MTHRQNPELREPDLPRTARVRKQALRLPAAGRELCGRVARVLTRFGAEAATGEQVEAEIRVIMVDFAGQVKIAEAGA